MATWHDGKLLSFAWALPTWALGSMVDLFGESRSAGFGQLCYDDWIAACDLAVEVVLNLARGEAGLACDAGKDPALFGEPEQPKLPQVVRCCMFFTWHKVAVSVPYVSMRPMRNRRKR